MRASPTSPPPEETKTKLIRAGLELFTERGFDGVSLGDILTRTSLPKGCFYHHFADKEAFVLSVIAAYDAYFLKKLDRHFGHAELPPLLRLQAFIDDAAVGLKKYHFKRGCLVGNLGQEMGGHTPAIRKALVKVWRHWEQRVAALLEEAQARRDISSKSHPEEIAIAFWMGWEGAVLRSKMVAKADPLHLFAAYFFQNLTPKK